MCGKKFSPNDIDVRVGQVLRMLRVRQGMTQRQLANALGVTFQQIQKYECAGNRISASMLCSIANILQVPVGTIFSESKQPYLMDPQMRTIIKKLYKFTPQQRRLVYSLIQNIAV